MNISWANDTQNRYQFVLVFTVSWRMKIFHSRTDYIILNCLVRPRFTRHANITTVLAFTYYRNCKTSAVTSLYLYENLLYNITPSFCNFTIFVNFAKPSHCWTTHQAIKTYVEWALKPRHLNLGIRRREWSNSRSGRFTTPDRTSPLPLERLLPVAQN